MRAETPPGTRWAYRVQGAEEGFEFYGTRYTAKTVAARTAGGLLRNALSKGGLALSGAVALVQNGWQYGTHPSQGTTFWDRTVKNREFWVSLGVDFGLNVAVGVASAAAVSGSIAIVLAILAGMGISVGAGVAIPTVAIVATLVVGAYISWRLDTWNVPEKLKAIINNKFTSGGK